MTTEKPDPDIIREDDDDDGQDAVPTTPEGDEGEGQDPENPVEDALESGFMTIDEVRQLEDEPAPE